VRYYSRPNVDQRSRDLIEDLGLPVAADVAVVEMEDHLARVPIVGEQGNTHLGRAS
jgi:hypothetical protein